MAPQPPLHRLVRRPDVCDWRDDELLSLAEAIALFFADGPFSKATLRIAIERGELAATMVCGKTFTTPAAIRDLLRLRVPSPGKVTPPD